ncbi:Reverse transcriptase (RNA-dependent DNA polymerase) [Popillia japonica]|uniref:Reverse transcriptase (RNA-dependent DNA polymerase) n=1 Tax=Popillia japonica TaxID=7064 RepID=A0AAW1N9E2_POPJA
MTLWSLVVDDLIRSLNDKGIWTQGYADDIVIVANGKFPGVVAGLMRNALRTVEEWCLVQGLSVNPLKTKLVAFTNIRKLNDLNSIKLFGQELQLTNEVLGVTFEH